MAMTFKARYQDVYGVVEGWMWSGAERARVEEVPRWQGPPAVPDQTIQTRCSLALTLQPRYQDAYGVVEGCTPSVARDGACSRVRFHSNSYP